MGHGLTKFDGTQIRRFPGEAIRHVRQNDTGVDRW
jgi:hypothetical protein